MFNLVTIVVTLVLAAIVWRIVRWMTRQSNDVAQPGAKLPPDKDLAIDRLKQPYNKTSEVPASSNQPSTTEKCSLKKTDLPHSQVELVSEQNRTKEKETSRDILQLELTQERDARERAEDWAEFLARELEAHISARIEAERRYRRLERKTNSSSPKISTAKDKKLVSRNFKDIDEAHKTWQKMRNVQNKNQKESDCLTYKPDHDENEWHHIVDANKRFLQIVTENKQRDNIATTSCEIASHNLQGNGLGSLTDGKNKEKINITVEACRSPGEEQKMLQGTSAAAVRLNDNNGHDDITKLRLPSNEQQNTWILKETSNSYRETTEADETEKDKNPLVCTDSLSNIKKTTEIWENYSASKEILSSGEDLSPTSGDLAEKKGLQVSCNDITPGLVQKNLKMYETSETVGNMESQ